MDALERVNEYKKTAKKRLDGIVQAYTGSGGVVNREGLLDWLLDAYVSLSVGREELIHMVDILRDHVLNWPETEGRAFTVDDARMLHVCRICKKAIAIDARGPFVLNFGKEFAHQTCLDGETRQLTNAQIAEELSKWTKECPDCGGTGLIKHNHYFCVRCKSAQHLIQELSGG